MPQHNYPRCYHEAKQRLAAGDDLRVRLAAGGGITVWFDGVPLVTFFLDGRIKVCTMGRNSFDYIQAGNAILPPRYKLSKKGSHVAVIDKRARRVLCKFLSSTVFSTEETIQSPDVSDAADSAIVSSFLRDPIMREVCR